MKIWEYKHHDKIMEHLIDVCMIKCDKIKAGGKPAFYWVFTWDKKYTKEEKIAKRKFKALKCCGQPMFRVSGNGLGYIGFTVTFIELTSYNARTRTSIKRNKLKSS